MMTTLILLGAGAVVALGIALWLLLRLRWLVGFVVGALGLSVLAVAVLLALMTYRLMQYEPVVDQTMLGTLTLTTRDSATDFEVALTHNRTMNRFQVTGDQWRLSGALVQVPQFLVFGPRERYFIANRVEGRFNRLEDELTTSRDERGEAWYLLLGDQALEAIFTTERLHAPLVPLVSGAIFTLEYRAGRLRLQAVNEPAEEALAP